MFPRARAAPAVSGAARPTRAHPQRIRESPAACPGPELPQRWPCSCCPLPIRPALVPDVGRSCCPGSLPDAARHSGPLRLFVPFALLLHGWPDAGGPGCLLPLPRAGAAAVLALLLLPAADPARPGSRRGPELLPWIAGPLPQGMPPAPAACCRSAGPAPAACCRSDPHRPSRSRPAATVRRRCRCRSAGPVNDHDTPTTTHRAQRHAAPPHHAGGPPAPGCNTYGVALIVTRTPSRYTHAPGGNTYGVALIVTRITRTRLVEETRFFPAQTQYQKGTVFAGDFSCGVGDPKI